MGAHNSETKAKSSAEFLAEATRILEAREVTHGGKLDNHSKLAVLWSAYLTIKLGVRVELNPSDAATLMLLLKVARQHSGAYNDDDDVDAVSYAAIAGELRAVEQASIPKFAPDRFEQQFMSAPPSFLRTMIRKAKRAERRAKRGAR